MKTALITGINGQDGSYLAEILLEEGMRVVGAVKDFDSVKLPSTLEGHVSLVRFDLHDSEAINEVLADNRIDEVYNFAAFSSGEGMFAHPIEIGEINGIGAARILESIRNTNPCIRFCQASSSEMFGFPSETPQTENSYFHPRTPYGSAKLYTHTMIDIYRRQYGVFACSAILYNHESPRRGLNFVTRKVTHSAAAIKMGLSNTLRLETLDARRDWGYAKDYVTAMRLMLTHVHPDDYVIATGRVHSIKDLCECAFGYLGMDFRDFVSVEGSAFRSPESIQLIGDASKARKNLGWAPTIEFSELIKLMVDQEIEQLKNNKPNFIQE